MSIGLPPTPPDSQVVLCGRACTLRLAYRCAGFICGKRNLVWVWKLGQLELALSGEGSVAPSIRPADNANTSVEHGDNPDPSILQLGQPCVPRSTVRRIPIIYKYPLKD